MSLVFSIVKESSGGVQEGEREERVRQKNENIAGSQMGKEKKRMKKGHFLAFQIPIAFKVTRCFVFVFFFILKFSVISLKTSINNNNKKEQKT